MSKDKILITHGNEAQMGALSDRELGISDDKKELYIGTSSENYLQITNRHEIENARDGYGTIEERIDAINTDLSANTSEIQVARSTYPSLSARPSASVIGTGGNGIYISVSDYSNNIATALATGKDVYVPKGDYSITQTLVVNPGQKLILAQGARILINANVDGVRVKSNAYLTGGIIRVNMSGWNKAAVLLDGADHIDVFTTQVSDITLMNGEWHGQYAYQGSGLLLRALNDDDYVMFAHFNNINILFFNKSIHLLAPRDTHAWINRFVNSNNFSNIITKGNYGIYIDGGIENQWQVAGNMFDSIQIQICAESASHLAHPSLGAVYCNGQANRIKALISDSSLVVDPSKIIEFSAGTLTSQYTKPSRNVVDVQYGYDPAHITDAGQNNFVIGSPDIMFNQNKSAGRVKIWTGTEAQYTAIATKDPNTLYFRKP